jgi:hypothetical protein
MRFLIVILLLTLIGASCKNSKRQLLSPKGKKVRFEVVTLQKQLGDCEKEEGQCARVDLKFPLVKAGKPALQQAINDSLLSEMLANLAFEEKKRPPTQPALESMADNFLYEWKRSTLDTLYANTVGWEVSVSGETGLHTPKVAVVSLATNSYAGGAHPNSYLKIFNFDLNTGKTLRWQDVITDLNALKILAEKKFKTARDLPPDADLTKEGFFWDEAFDLPQNFELQEQAIYFWYNAYEAASYADGPTEFVISYAELGKLFLKEKVF